MNTRLGDVASVLSNTKNTLDAELRQIARSLAAWMVIVKKEKAVYDTLNKFSYDQARKTLIAEAWCPTNSLALIKSTLQDVNDRAGCTVPTIVNQIRDQQDSSDLLQRPTSSLMDSRPSSNAYGIPKYQEVNPACLPSSLSPSCSLSCSVTAATVHDDHGRLCYDLLGEEVAAD